MPTKSYKPEEIVAKLRQVDVLTSQGKDTPGRHPSISVALVSSPKPMRRPRKPTGRR